LFTQAELDDMEPNSARMMEILIFVKVEEIDPIYLDASYYDAPEDAGAKAYHLLRNAMIELEYAAIAKVTTHNREYLVIIRARKEGLTLHTMFYRIEIRPVVQYGSTDKSEINEQEKSLTIRLIETLATHFKPQDFSDTCQQNLQKLLDAKAHGQKLSIVPHNAPGPVINPYGCLEGRLVEACNRNQGRADQPRPNSGKIAALCRSEESGAYEEDSQDWLTPIFPRRLGIVGRGISRIDLPHEFLGSRNRTGNGALYTRSDRCHYSGGAEARAIRSSTRLRPSNRTYTVRPKPDLGFRTKNGQIRLVPLPQVLIDALKTYVVMVPQRRLIFVNSQGGPEGHFLSKCKRIAVRAGLNCGHCVNKQRLSCKDHPVCAQWTLHKFRRTWATMNLLSGMPITLLQNYIGHSDLETLNRYLARISAKSDLAKQLADNMARMTNIQGTVAADMVADAIKV
jgi:non-homologous end joining protein Ku